MTIWLSMHILEIIINIEKYFSAVIIDVSMSFAVRFKQQGMWQCGWLWSPTLTQQAGTGMTKGVMRGASRQVNVTPIYTCVWINLTGRWCLWQAICSPLISEFLDLISKFQNSDIKVSKLWYQSLNFDITLILSFKTLISNIQTLISKLKLWYQGFKTLISNI